MDKTTNEAPARPALTPGARLDGVLADAAALAGEHADDVHVDVGRGTVAVYAVVRTGGRNTIVERPRNVEVWRHGGANGLGSKAYAEVTVEGTVAQGLRKLAAEKRVEAERALATARGALRRAEEVAEQAAARERRLEAIVRADLDAVGERGEPTHR